MVINDSLPAPTLYFKEGETAIIHVSNKMDVESSIHWHGILLPNFQDGVPYLTTPPIKPGATHTFTFPLKQSGTYWYHSHTGLQEQRGIYGAIVIEAKEKKWTYDHNLTLVLSDWTDEKPKEVLRKLKRGSEWYSIKKQTTQSLYQVITHKALGAQLQMWRQRMPGMDISDVYYPTFLVNGQKTQNYPQFKAGEKIRLRVINAGASTYFWLSFGEEVLLISADGIDVQPVSTDKMFQAIGETYDFLLTVPEDKSIEFRATAQDGSGFATAVIGKGKLLEAAPLSKPDLMEQMKRMVKSHGTKGHGKVHHSSNHTSPENKMEKIETPQTSHIHKEKDHTNNKKISYKKHSHQEKYNENTFIQKQSQDNQSHHIQKLRKDKKNTHQDNNQRKGVQKKDHRNREEKYQNKTHHEARKHTKSLIAYDHLRSDKKTQFSKTLPIKELHLNLTGNMRRYVWSMNGKVLSESDKIKINQNELVRLILHNQTMMHHPMHLHGHFFRVITKQGEHSPLKHTVDVPPMETVTLEFLPDEKGDWFFHCHVLYHMKGGMARVFSHGNIRDQRLKNFPLSQVWYADRQWYSWGELSLMSNRADLEWEISNTRNRILFAGTVSWVDKFYRFHKNYELETSYEHFFTDFFRIYTGLKAQNSYLDQTNNIDLAGRIGVRYLLPYLIELDLSLDHKKRLELELEYELLLLPRLEFLAVWSWTEYLKRRSQTDTKKREQEWLVGLDYTINSSFSLVGSYDSHFSWGAGINWKF